MEQLGILMSVDADEIVANQCITECYEIVDCPDCDEDEDA